MKRVLFVGPYPPVYGGYATQIYHLSSFLRRNGFKTTVLSFENEEKIECPEENLEVVRIDKRKNLKVLFSNLGNIPIFLSLWWKGVSIRDIVLTIIKYRICSRIIAEKNIELVITYNLYNSLFGPFLRRDFGNRVVLFCMVFGEVITGMGAEKRYWEFLRSVLLSFDKVISSSQYCAKLYGRVGYDIKDIQVIYVGVDIDSFSANTAGEVDVDALKIPPESTVILFFGRFLRDMGLDVVLESIPSILKKNNEVCFFLAGAEGELSERAKRLESKYPGRVFVRQNVSFQVLPSYYRKCNMLLAPTKSLRACMGISIKEAMVCGKPVIASDSGGIPEAVVNNETGIVIPLEGKERVSPKELEQAMETLIRNPNLARKMGMAGRKRALKMFDSRHEAECWLRLMKKYLSEN